MATRFAGTVRNAVWPAAIALMLAGTVPDAAAAPPAALYGKSIVVSWIESSQQRNVGESNWRSVSRSVTLSVYVSTAGRVFSRQTNAVARVGSGSTDQVAGQPGGSGPQRIPVFSGHDMTLYGVQQGGARRIAVSFDAGFTGCTATALFAKEVGRSSFRRISPINGRTLEIATVSPGPATCTIRSGNVFAGGE